MLPTGPYLAGGVGSTVAQWHSPMTTRAQHGWLGSTVAQPDDDAGAAWLVGLPRAWAPCACQRARVGARQHARRCMPARASQCHHIAHASAVFGTLWAAAPTYASSVYMPPGLLWRCSCGIQQFSKCAGHAMSLGLLWRWRWWRWSDMSDKLFGRVLFMISTALGLHV